MHLLVQRDFLRAGRASSGGGALIPGLVLRREAAFRPAGALSTTVPELAQDTGNLGLTLLGIGIVIAVAVGIYKAATK